MPSFAEVEWPAIVAAVAASVGVVVAVVFHGFNLKANRLSNSAKMVHDLYQVFQTDGMLRHRAAFAAALLDPTRRDQIDLRKDNPLLEFFEGIAYSTRKKVLDRGMVWNLFSFYIEPYYLEVIGKELTPDGVRRETKTDLLKKARRRGFYSLYGEFERLAEQLLVLSDKEERRRRPRDVPKADVKPWSREDLDHFLADEAQLAPPAAAAGGSAVAAGRPAGEPRSTAVQEHLTYLKRMEAENVFSAELGRAARAVWEAVSEVSDLPVPAAATRPGGPVEYHWESGPHQMSVEIPADEPCHWFYRNKSTGGTWGTEAPISDGVPPQFLAYLRLLTGSV